MLTDTRILHRHGGCEVIVQQHHIGWPDGTSLALHPLRMNGCDDLWRRAVLLPDGRCMVFDLRQICPALRTELAILMPRDHQGCVMHRLRLSFGSADQVLALIERHSDLEWYPSAAAPVMDAWQQAPLLAA